MGNTKTIYYNDVYNTYRNEAITSRIRRLIKKYVVIDAGQLIIGSIGLLVLVI